MATINFDYVPILHDQRTIAHVFVAPQDLKGLGIGYITPVKDGNRITIGGDIFIGNPQDGTYNVAFELTTRNDAEGMLLLGDEEYDLTKGRSFVVKEGYKIAQLPFQSKEDALKVLTMAKGS